MIEIERPQAGVTCVTLNRPEKRNALSIEMMKALCTAIDEVAADPEQRVLVLRGSSPTFCSGLDLEEAADLSCAHPSAEWYAKLLEQLALTPLLTVCAASGVAAAGGAGLLAACDFAIASDDLKIGFPETRVGLVPAMVMTLLYHRIGDRALRELMLLAEFIPASRALEMGLLTRVISSSSLEWELDQVVDSLLGTAPVAASRTKKLIRELRHPDLSSELHQVLTYHLQARTSEEAEEGIRAFRERREPNWAVPGGEV